MASPRAVLVTASAAQVAAALIGIALPVIGPQIADQYGLSLPGLGLVLTANILGQGISLIFAGAAVERYGGRLTTIAGVSVAVAGISVAAFAPTTAVLVVALFISGLGSATVPIAGMGAVFRVYEQARRAWALGMRQMAVPVAGIVGAFLMPILDAAGGVRLALLVSAGALAVLGMLFALTGAGASPGQVAARVGLKAVARILRSPGIIRLLLVALFYTVVLQSALSYLVPSLRDQGLTTFWASAAFFAMQLSAAVSRVMWGRIADRHGGGRRIRTLAEVGWASAVGGVVFALLLGTGIGGVIIGTILFGLGALGWNALVYVSAGERGPPELPAQSVAVAAAVVFTVAAASSPAMGALAQSVGWIAFWVICAGFAIAGSAVAMSIARQDRDIAREA